MHTPLPLNAHPSMYTPQCTPLNVYPSMYTPLPLNAHPSTPQNRIPLKTFQRLHTPATPRHGLYVSVCLCVWGMEGGGGGLVRHVQEACSRLPWWRSCRKRVAGSLGGGPAGSVQPAPLVAVLQEACSRLPKHRALHRRCARDKRGPARLRPKHRPCYGGRDDPHCVPLSRPDHGML
jgi:hypothetical protein